MGKKILNIIKEEFENFFPLAPTVSLVNEVGEEGQVDTDSDVLAQDEYLNDNFWEWFGNSKVVNPDGSPMIVYHGSGADFNVFEKGDIGFHFGTKKVAISRLRSKKIYGGKRVFKGVYLKIENPLEMRDIGGWYASKFAQELENIGVLGKGEGDTSEKWYELTHQYGYNKTSNWNYDAANRELTQYIVDKIKAKGYDGIKYTNNIEDSGSISWIVFEPTQIKSAENNNGEFNPSNSDILKERKKVKRMQLPIGKIFSIGLNEVGEASVQPYPYTKEIKSNKYGAIHSYHFITEDNDKYVAHITEQDDGSVDIDFKVLGTGSADTLFGYATIINKGRLFRVLSTMSSIIKEYVKENQPDEIRIEGTKSEGDEDLRRLNIYMAFIKKNLPREYYISIIENLIIIRKKQSLHEVVKEEVTNFLKKNI